MTKTPKESVLLSVRTFKATGFMKPLKETPEGSGFLVMTNLALILASMDGRDRERFPLDTVTTVKHLSKPGTVRVDIAFKNNIKRSLDFARKDKALVLRELVPILADIGVGLLSIPLGIPKNLADIHTQLPMQALPVGVDLLILESIDSVPDETMAHNQPTERGLTEAPPPLWTDPQTHTQKQPPLATTEIHPAAMENRLDEADPPSNNEADPPSNNVADLPSDNVTHPPSSSVAPSPPNEVADVPSNSVPPSPPNKVADAPSNTVITPPSYGVADPPSRNVADPPLHGVAHPPLEQNTVTPPHPVTETTHHPQDFDPVAEAWVFPPDTDTVGMKTQQADNPHAATLPTTRVASPATRAHKSTPQAPRLPEAQAHEPTKSDAQAQTPTLPPVQTHQPTPSDPQAPEPLPPPAHASTTFHAQEPEQDLPDDTASTLFPPQETWTDTLNQDFDFFGETPAQSDNLTFDVGTQPIEQSQTEIQPGASEEKKDSIMDPADPDPLFPLQTPTLDTIPDEEFFTIPTHAPTKKM